MNTSTSVGFISFASKEKHWISLEQETVSEAATYEETSEVIDELFELDPCNPDPSDEEQVESTEERDQKRAEMLEKLKKIISGEIKTKLCEDAQGKFVALVRVYRSHQDIPYNLNYMACTFLSQVSGRIKNLNENFPVENATSLEMDLPYEAATAEWSGKVLNSSGEVDPPPDLVVTTGGIFWGRPVTGTIRVVAQFPYDLIEVEASVEGSEMLAFYEKSVDQVEIEAPPEDEKTTELCTKIGSIDVPSETGDCFIEKTIRTLCKCTKNQNGIDRILVATGCPEGVAPGSIVRREDAVEYVGCGEEEEVHDPDYYKDKCCEYPPSINFLPYCKKVYSPFGGRVTSEDMERLRKLFDGDAKLIGVGPKQSPCGTHTREQKVKAKNCCDGVPDIVHDTENSTELIARLSDGDVYITGGIGPFTWKVRGKGFYVDYQRVHRDKITYSRKLTIYTNSTCCGSAVVYVSDGCSSVSFYVRCTEGIWSPIPPESLPVSGVAADVVTGASQAGIWGIGFCTLQAFVGKYKIQQTFTSHSGSSDVSKDGAIADFYSTCLYGIPLFAIDPIASTANGVINPTDPLPYYMSTSAFRALGWSNDGGLYTVNDDGRWRAFGACVTNKAVSGVVGAWEWTCGI